MTQTTADSAGPGGSIGLTRDTGWEIGVRRTLPLAVDALWDTLLSAEGQSIWLGSVGEFSAVPDQSFRLDDGTTGEVRSVETGTLIRLRWRPPDRHGPTTLQIRILPAKTGTTLAIHHEQLDDAADRERMRAHWTTVVDRLAALTG